MSDNREQIEQIKSSIDIVKYIGRHVTLTKEGNSFRGATSTQSKSGKSLVVDSQLQVYNNFANDDSGDVFNWIAFEEGLDIESDFQQILSIAAEYAGVEFEHISTDYIEDKQTIYPLLAEIADFYHGLLTDNCRKYISEKWGISKEMIDKLKIGWAPGNNELLLHMKKRFPDDVLVKSGMFYAVGGKKPGNDFFQNRIIFPYWKNEKAVYFIGRDPQWSRDSKEPKYKKQMVHSKTEYVSPIIDNSVFYGEDSIKKEDSVIITEGVTDCIKVLQEGLPCISPVTISIKEDQKEYAYQLTKNKKEVIICNDNEDNGSGKKGAISTAEYLESKGVYVRVVELPRPNGVEKIDLAEYLQNHTKEDFERLPSNNVWEIKLNAQDVPSNTTEKTRAIQRFLINDLKSMEPAQRDIFIRNDVREYFGLSKRDMNTLLKSVRWDTDEEEKEDLDFFTHQGKLKTKKLGEYIMSLARFVTFDDTKTVFVYRNGVYIPRGEDLIAKMVQSSLGDLSKKQHISEIINYVQLETLVPRSKINHDITIINIKNGLFNLRTGQLEPHTPDYISIIQLPITYDSDAECPAIDKFVSEVLQPIHHDVIYEIIGYCMVPDTRIEKSVMFLGKGANGKSVMLSMISTFLGSSNTAAESLHALESDPYSLAELYGKLANIFPDLASKAIYENSTFKMLSGNEHEIRAQRKYEHPFKFKNTARLIFSANNLPPAPNGDYAYYRRWIPIKFPYTFEGDAADKNLINKITTDEEMSGLFNKCISRLQRVLAECKYSYDLSTDEVEVMYKINSDPIAAFVDEMVIYSDGDTLKAVMYKEYVDWCGRNGIEYAADNAFARRFRKLGYEASREPTGMRQYVWENCAVSEVRPSLKQNPSGDDFNPDENKSLSTNTILSNPSGLLKEKYHCNVVQENKKENEKNKCAYVNNRVKSDEPGRMETETRLLQSNESASVFVNPSRISWTNMSLGEKMNEFRKICADCSDINELRRECIAVGFEQWHEIFTKMQETGEIMTDGKSVRLV